jgi:aminoglycoside phosphotransferase (APT) family kinase protein
VGGGEPGGTMYEFWWGCHHLFGIDPRRVFDLEPLNACLNRVSPIPAPRVLRQGHLEGRPFVVVERMPGTALPSFRDQPAALLEEFGAALAWVHSFRFTECGSPTGCFRYPLTEFHDRLVETMQQMVEREYQGEPRIRAELEGICRAAGQLPPPDAGALVLVDIGAEQFLTDGRRLTAVVDTEAYVIGPRELDFIGLEYSLDAQSAAPFLAGYRSVLPPPNLSQVRHVYRYFYRLLGVKGQVDLDQWLGWPSLFVQDGGSRIRANRTCENST